MTTSVAADELGEPGEVCCGAAHRTTGQGPRAELQRADLCRAGTEAAFMSNSFEAAVRLPTRLWQIIDGTIDNTVSIAAEAGDDDLVADGTRIREAGWRQICGWTSYGAESRGWPPAAELVTVTLPQTAWELVLAELDRWNAVSAVIGGDEEVRLGQDARQIVHEQLP